MRLDGQIVIFCHSLLSDWNHGNAHFLRGIVSELQARGEEVVVYEPRDNWSLQNLLSDLGPEAVEGFHDAYPTLDSVFYDPALLRLDRALSNARLVLVHEWTDPYFARRLGQHRASHPHYRLLFHDTHHRLVTDPGSMAHFDLSGYDGVLAFGSLLRDLYLKTGRTRRAWTWHEAADTKVFKPSGELEEEKKKSETEPQNRALPLNSQLSALNSPSGDLVWIGNWGDEERTNELHEFLIEPVRDLGLRARVYGVRYPARALRALADAGIEYAGALSNYAAPQVFARYKMTIHVPRGPYVRALPGIPTIRMFEALACGIPLICAPWNDAEGLFTPGKDYLTARDGRQMRQQMQCLLRDPERRQEMARRGLQTIRARHTCAHRADELLRIYQEIA